jgi:hypothetical protein
MLLQQLISDQHVFQKTGEDIWLCFRTPSKHRKQFISNADSVAAHAALSSPVPRSLVYGRLQSHHLTQIIA